MNFLDVKRVAYCVDHGIPIPDRLAVELVDAINDYVADDASRPLDFYLGLCYSHANNRKKSFLQRDELYRKYAGKLKGSNWLKSQVIEQAIQRVEAGEFDSANLDSDFADFWLGLRALSCRGLSARSIRRILAE